MANFKVKRLPPIKLVDLLKKRKTTLKNFLDVYGIVAYPTLCIKCDSMGVSPPSEEDFKKCLGKTASSPQEGVLVLDPPTLTKELTGEKISVDESNNFHSVEVKVVTATGENAILEEKNSKKNEKIKIDESVYVTVTKTFDTEISGSSLILGEATSVEDDINSSVSKLSTLKKSK